MRLYPAGAVGGQVVGFVGRDGAGLAGIEQTFQDELAGTDGHRRVEVGSGGNPIPSGIDESTPAIDGDTVKLTLDQDLQYVTDQRLGGGVRGRRHHPGLGGRPRRAHRPGASRWAPAPATTPATTRRPTPTCWATRPSPTSSSPAR